MPKAIAPVKKPKVTSEAASKKTAAKALDAQIDKKITDCSEKLVRAYLDLAKSLKLMRDTEGYKLLDKEFKSWEEYLESKREFGRTYLSYLYKLGQVEGLDQYAAKGLSASQFIECAKVASGNEIAGLLAETAEAIKGKTVKETREHLKEHLAAKKLERIETVSNGKRGRKPFTWRERFQNQFRGLSDAERPEFIKQLREFLATEEVKAAEDA